MRGLSIAGAAGNSVGVMKALFLASAAALLAVPACAGDWTDEAGDWTLSPYTADFDPVSLTVGGKAWGALFAPDLPKAAGAAQRWATGAADLSLKFSRDYDSGMSLGLNTSFEVARDRLSYDNYGGAFVQKVYGVMQTGLGSVEFGMTDGAASVLSVIGPMADDITSIDNPNATFFIDPATGRAFNDLFQLSTAPISSSNYAKLSYYTPRILGIEIGVSYTPSEGREVIPFLNNGPQAGNRQKSIWETAVSYAQQYDGWAIGAYGSALFGHGDGKGASDAGLTEWAFGAEVDYDLNDEWKLAFGGGYRHSNANAFDIYSVSTLGGTESSHLSATVSDGQWIFGTEYGKGTADDGATVIGTRGWQLSVGYVVNQNWQVSAGWQDLSYDRNTGSFYDGSNRIGMKAAFLGLKLKV